MAETDLSSKDKLRALWRVVMFKPKLAVFIILFSFFAALLEGIGLTFLIPIIDVAQAPGDPAAEAEGLAAYFVMVYEFLGIPFSLGFIILGLAAVMTVRFTSSFIVAWLQIALKTQYIRQLQSDAFENALHTEVAYYDEHGSDDVLNAIVTQAEYAGKVIRDFVNLFEKILLATMYLALAMVLSPSLTVITILILGVLTIFIRHVLEPGYVVGDRVADANEQVQRSVQAGVQGIRDVKLFTKEDPIYETFSEAIEQFEHSSIRLGRNEAAIDKFYNLSAALVVFGLIYGALTFANLSLGALGVFLFAMFQLAPMVSSINNKWYKVEGRLPHLVRTQEFTEQLADRREPRDDELPVPEQIREVEFQNVSFSYNDDERVLEDISFNFTRGEFVAFVGASGAGKSTIASLLARMYEPDSGRILANGRPISDMNPREWREKIAVVRQDPYMFNDTLWNNVTVGNEGADEAQVRKACEVARVSEFLHDLPDGYDTELGDNGVRLSGGQRQRVSLARALLKDAQVLVLDEATSDLDSGIESDVQEAIETIGDDYAMLTIAHRLSTITGADRIYGVERGEIVEVGPHNELVEGNGVYAKLYTAQHD